MEQSILRLFLYNDRLKFNEIEKSSGKRSNILSYHIKKMLNEGIITKDHGFYKLSEDSESIIPYITEKRPVLPVVLVAIKENDRIFLHKREKRPYKGLLGLPGGRVLLGETIKEATERIMKEKFGVNCKFRKVNSVSIERIKKNNKIIHSFLLIFVTASTKDKINFTDLKRSRKGIIESDYRLIKEDLNSKIKIKDIFSRV